MSIRQRFAAIIIGSVGIMAALAYFAVNVAEKPANWLNLAFLVFYLALLGVLAWSFKPVAAKMQSVPMRYVVQSLGTLISFIVLAFLCFNIFIHFCVIFG
jgi:hypothetical protein